MSKPRSTTQVTSRHVTLNHLLTQSSLYMQGIYNTLSDIYLLPTKKLAHNVEKKNKKRNHSFIRSAFHPSMAFIDKSHPFPFFFYSLLPLFPPTLQPFSLTPIYNKSEKRKKKNKNNNNNKNNTSLSPFRTNLATSH